MPLLISWHQFEKVRLEAFLDRDIHLEEAHFKSRIIVELKKILKTKKIKLPQLYVSDPVLT